MDSRILRYGGISHLNYDDSTPGQLQYDGRAPGPYEPDMSHHRNHVASHKGRLGKNGTSATASQGIEYGRLTPPAVHEAIDEDLYEVSASEFYASQDLRQGRRKATSVAAPHAVKGVGEFDFNDTQQLNPWRCATPQQTKAPELNQMGSLGDWLGTDVKVRQFAESYDEELRTYLAARSISLGFLAEIDQFLKGHTEIATCAEGRNTLRQITVLPPLQAYKYFLRGYTRPARYVDGVIRTGAFKLPSDFAYEPLSTKRDPELIDFFHGYDYRHDIIERIDDEVYSGVQKLANRKSIPLGLRKLICYAIWGNPADAYKWYEYSYQNEYMPHRRLPEHVVLTHVPKPANYTELQTSVLNVSKNHGHVRYRMARANDQGTDVLKVLIAEYRHSLIRRARRRHEIEERVAKAKQRLDRERQDPTGVDIVDLVMNDAVSRKGRLDRGGRKGTHDRGGFRPFSPTSRRALKLRTRNIKIHGSSRPVIRGAEELCQAKAALLHLYEQEQHVVKKKGGSMADESSRLMIVRRTRATAERRYVNMLIRYCRDTDRMTRQQAAQLQKHFTRKSMTDLSVSHGKYLLSLYPSDLK